MDKKAQASNVFNLLISAIVALAILVILFGILSSIGIINPQGVPSTEAKNQLAAAFNSPATTKTSQNVIFNSSENNLNTTAIAMSSNVGITDSQICLSLGDFAGENLFSLNDNKTSLNFSGTATKSAKIAAFCYIGSQLQEKLEEINSGIKSEWASNCPCAENDSEQVCCIIALKFQSAS